MFIGVIRDTGIVRQAEPELAIKVDSDLAIKIEVGSHIAVNGRVLKVLSRDVDNEVSYLKFYASNLSQSKRYLPQEKVNLERAVRLGEEIPGTFFYGIPTASVRLTSKEFLSDGKFSIKVSFENDLVNYLSVMDQVCLEGILLQIVDIDRHLLSFNVYPSTLETTNLQDKQLGDELTIEIDPFTIKIAKVLQKLN